MVRTLAVLLLLLGLATATPVVCLCAPPLAPAGAAPAGASGGASPIAGPSPIVGDVGDPRLARHGSPSDDWSSAAFTVPARSGAVIGDATVSLISSSAAAAVAAIVATAAGLPSTAPWRLPRLAVVGRARSAAPTRPAGPAWTPAVPPPR